MPSAESSSGDRRGDTPPESDRRSDRLIRRLGRVTVGVCAASALALAIGFFLFVRGLPSEEIRLDRNADGIVVLTGGPSRVTDALELLAEKRAQRLLISGAHPMTDGKDISRLHPEFAAMVRCCVDFDRSLNTLGNAVEIGKWARQRNIRSLIVVTSGFHMPRAISEIGHQLPGVTLIAFPVIADFKSEPFWPDGARRLGLEYLKLVFAHIRMRVNPDAGISE